MASTLDSYTKSYNSFSGADMVVTFGKYIIGELQGISYTIQREKAPQYVLGQSDPVSFSRGKRGIAGSCVFLVFDRSALLDAFQDTPFLAWEHEFAALVSDPIVSAPVLITAGLSSASSGYGQPQTANSFAVANSIQISKILARPAYHDQVLPFEIVVTGANEYGATASMKIHGVEVINVGSGFSIDDMQIDEACTWIAKGITNWRPGIQIHIPNYTLPTTIAG